MEGFILRTINNKIIRFAFYNDSAPITSKTFSNLLPFSRTFIHARLSGQEIWVDHAIPLDIIQENASVFVEPGEVVYGPLNPKRAKTSNCMGIYYGDGKGLDCCNIFAKVFEEDKKMLEELGIDIWKHGTQELLFEKLP